MDKKLTSKDIEALREYLDKMEALDQERPPALLTDEEWTEAMDAIRATGKIPEKYEGRIAKTDIGGYYGVAEEAYEERFRQLNDEYKDLIIKAFMISPRLKPGEAIGVLDLVSRLLEDPEIRKQLAQYEKPKTLDIVGLPNLLPTDKRFQYAISTLRNDNAYIMPFDFEELQFRYDDSGEIVIDTKAQYDAIEKAKDKENKIRAAGIDQPLLRQLFAATMAAYLSNYGNTITVYLPAFAREMNIDISGANKMAEAKANEDPEAANKHKANDFFKKLSALESLAGVWLGGSFYRVFILEGYDHTQNTLSFSSPWFFKIVRELLQTPTKKKTRPDGSIIWEITGISSLMKPSIVSARSKPTVEIIACLISGLQQRGTKTEAERHPQKKYEDPALVEYSISFKTLIERIPLIMENLTANTNKPSNQTTLLQRYFCGNNLKARKADKKRVAEGTVYILNEYIKEHTYLHEYYKDFEIIFQPPTVNTLSDKIIIRHHGINGDFAQSNPLNKLRFNGVLEEDEEESVVTPEQQDVVDDPKPENNGK